MNTGLQLVALNIYNHQFNAIFIVMPWCHNYPKQVDPLLQSSTTDNRNVDRLTLNSHCIKAVCFTGTNIQQDCIANILTQQYVLHAAKTHASTGNKLQILNTKHH